MLIIFLEKLVPDFRYGLVRQIVVFAKNAFPRSRKHISCYKLLLRLTSGGGIDPVLLTLCFLDITDWTNV